MGNAPAPNDNGNPVATDAPVVVFDAKSLSDRLSGDGALIRKVVNIFMEETPKRMRELEQAVKNIRAMTPRGWPTAIKGSAWNGTGRFTHDRIGRGTIDIESVIFSVMGGITPSPLSDYLRQAVGEGALDDGLMQRFQLAAWPDTTRTGLVARIYGNHRYSGDADHFLVFSYVAVLFDPEGHVANIYSDFFFCNDWDPGMPTGRRD